MPDIAMCIGKGCPKKNNCYRYTATPDQWGQSYCDFENTCPKNNYKDFWDNNKNIKEKNYDNTNN